MDRLGIQEFLNFLNQKIGAKALFFNEAGLYKGTYPSRVEDVKGDMVAFSHPLLKGALLPVLRGVELKLRVEADGMLYQGIVTVIRGAPLDGIPMLWVSPVSEAVRVQRRYFVRVPCLLKTAFYRLEGKRVKPDQEEWITAVSRDISLGGVAASAYRSDGFRFTEQDRVLIRLPVQDEVFFLTGRLVRKFLREENWEMGFAFDAVPGFVEKVLGAFIRRQEMAGRQ
ncbi:MAG: flagellar brake protein [Aminivibrio sp.]|jgi:c-di-GMP-binding flagellar brake protein YcgR